MLIRYSAGDPIVSYCTKCKQSLDHIISVMEGKTVSKVRCRVCGGVHKYRNPVTVKPTRTRKKTAVPVAVLWQAYMSKARGKELVYNMTGRYRVGDIVVHDKFGKGVVRKLSMNKCHVVFQDKERLMASAN
jgi:hypothetical protein